MSMADLILSGVDDKVLITFCCGAVIFLVTGFMTMTRFYNSTAQRSRSESNNENRNHRSFENDDCPICLAPQTLAVETNCGHKFCGLCLKNYLNHSSTNFSTFSSPMSCLLCRQNVNILLLCFTSEEMQSIELEYERTNVERFVHEYNICFDRGPRTLWSYVRDCPVLIRHMFFDFFTFGGLVWMFRLRVMLCCLVAIIYFFNPFDIISESVFGIFGFLDDILVFLLCVIYMSFIYRRVIIRRATANAVVLD